jgi:hypothetical protein
MSFIPPITHVNNGISWIPYWYSLPLYILSYKLVFWELILVQNFVQLIGALYRKSPQRNQPGEVEKRSI